jgi:biopolymer transport protein ExbD
MKFRAHQRRQAPAVIIISLIDILIVLLIFLMVTTTFKQYPAVKLSLPESRQAKAGAAENLMIVTVAKNPPHYYLNTVPVTLTKLQEEFTRRIAENTNATVAIRPDKEATVEQFFPVVEAANAAKLRTQINVFVKPGGTP